MSNSSKKWPNQSRLRVVLGCVFLLASAMAEAQSPLLPWQPIDIPLKTAQDHPWWEFPVTATFTHAETQKQIAINAFYDGQRKQTLRFAAPLAGEWRYETKSADASLDGQTGSLQVEAASESQVKRNPNLRGQARISDSQRYFEYADGTPVLLLADTNWAINTARCGLGKNHDGPFYEYLADRKSKGFNTILIAYLHGYGDYKTPVAHRNEAGYPYQDQAKATLNAKYLQSLDTRIQSLWADGFVIAAHPAWFGKLNCSFDFESAKRISAYLAVRYGAYNALWSLSGEYQYAMKDCHWTDEQINELGETIQSVNPYRHPLSIHPSGRTNWAAPHGSQSSRAFHDSSWLDCNWLQTGQRSNSLYCAATRTLENYVLKPVKPVFLSEGFYERFSDPEHVYHSRWQVWTALLNGAGGYGYGAFGMWQFYDPNDPQKETGKITKVGEAPWPQTLKLAGSQQILPVRKLLSKLPWHKMHPNRDALRVAGESNPMPTSTDISPPHAAATAAGLLVVYVPRGNAGKQISINQLGKRTYSGYWYDPRTAQAIPLKCAPQNTDKWVLPDRPQPKKDWVLVLTPKNESS